MSFLLFILGFVFNLAAVVGIGPSRSGHWHARVSVTGRKRRDDLADLMVAADFSDIVALAVRAGATPRQAMLQGARSLDERTAPVVVGKMVMLGLPLADSVRRARNGQGGPVEEVLETIAFSSSLGTALGPTLERQSAALRAKALSELEARAGKAPVAMLFPLVLCLLPEILILLVAGAGRELLSLLGF